MDYWRLEDIGASSGVTNMEQMFTPSTRTSDWAVDSFGRCSTAPECEACSVGPTLTRTSVVGRSTASMTCAGCSTATFRLQTGTDMSRSSVDSVTTCATCSTATSFNQDLGWCVDDVDGRRVLRHSVRVDIVRRWTRPACRRRFAAPTIDIVMNDRTSKRTRCLGQRLPGRPPRRRTVTSRRGRLGRDGHVRVCFVGGIGWMCTTGIWRQLPRRPSTRTSARGTSPASRT